MLDENKLNAELLERGRMKRGELARRAGYAPSTFSAYVTGLRRAPPDFRARVELALGLPPGALRPDATRGDQ